jgi:hypothetical protein
MSKISTQAYHRKATRLTLSATTDAKGESAPTDQLIHTISCSPHGHHRLKPHGEAEIIEYIHEAQDVFGLRDSFAAAFPSICKERLDDVIRGLRVATREGLWPRRRGNLKVDMMPTIHVTLTGSTVHPMRLGRRKPRPDSHGTLVRHPFYQPLSGTIAVSIVDDEHLLAVNTVLLL